MEKKTERFGLIIEPSLKAKLVDLAWQSKKTPSEYVRGLIDDAYRKSEKRKSR